MSDIQPTLPNTDEATSGQPMSDTQSTLPNTSETNSDSTQSADTQSTDTQITKEEFMKKYCITQGQMDAIEDIIDRFNFERVHYCMKALDWKWRQADGIISVPTIDELKIKASYLLVKSIKETVIATGGFEATYLKDTEDNTENFSLAFLLSWWDETVINDTSITKEDTEEEEDAE